MKHRGARLGLWIWVIFASVGMTQAGCDLAIRFHAAPPPANVARAAGDIASAKKAPPLPKSGDVLIAGGVSTAFKSTAVAEFFDPTTNKFSLTKPMTTARASAVGAALPGTETKVLVAGGALVQSVKFKKRVATITAGVLNTADLYDPSTGSFEQTTGQMASPRVAATATLFTSGPLAGQVLIAGGIDENGNILNTAQIFDPATGNFTAAGNNMSDPRAFHTATLLNDGTVLLAGGARSNDGTTTNSADLFDPSTGKFSSTGNMNTGAAARSATLLNDGTVLIAGGAIGIFNQITAIVGAEIYNPAAKTFTNLSTTLNVPRALHTATLLPDNTVLLAGGQTGTYLMPQKNQFTFAQGDALNSAEIFDPAGPSFTCVGGAGCPKSMVNARMAHGATVLGSGKILITGGLGGKKATSRQKVLKTAEEFDPGTKTFTALRPMKKPHAFHVSALLANAP